MPSSAHRITPDFQTHAGDSESWARPVSAIPHAAPRMVSLAVGALGVVFGDIGTSPLYAFKECFHPAFGLDGIGPGGANVYGVLSLIFWSLTIVVAIKYLIFILRADNHGEGGIMALIALLAPKVRTERGGLSRLILFGLFGAALLYGDGIITPAISVLSAIEGLQIATPAFEPVVVPLTVAILIGLFAMQSHGTSHIGRIFGPATLVWFVVIAAMGIPAIARHPQILWAVNPIHAIRFLAYHGGTGFLVLGAVVLCITGAEALYADMGHFGKRPIRFAWFAIVFPALLLNYFGQGALLITEGSSAIAHPFYGLVPSVLLIPTVILATVATVIASQALISGAYSLTQQAVQLGYLPRIQIHHTSSETVGQIYVPRINQLLMVGCVLLVLVFRHSSALAAAYGIAVTGTMLITSVLFYQVARSIWGWSPIRARLLVGAFLVVDSAFFLANVTKLMSGGWIPVLIAGCIFVLMTTWKRGREQLKLAMVAAAIPLDKFFEKLLTRRVPRVHGTAVFLTVTRDVAPPVLRHHFRHNQALHERVVLLSIVSEVEPAVPPSRRVSITDLGHDFYKVVARYGFMEKPDIIDILFHCLNSGLPVEVDDVSFYVGRETFDIVPVSPWGYDMARWRKRLFVVMSRNARPASDYFGLPPDQVIEIGARVQI